MDFSKIRNLETTRKLPENTHHRGFLFSLNYYHLQILHLTHSPSKPPKKQLVGISLKTDF